MTAERLHVLEMVENGKISADEGVLLLKALTASEPFEESLKVDSVENESLLSYTEISSPPVDSMRTSNGIPGEAITISQATDLPEQATRWRSFWTIPLWIGLGISLLGVALVYLASKASSQVVFWMICASLPLVFGVILVLFAFSSRGWPWLHLRVHQPPGESPQRIALSFPLPVRPAAWILRTFGKLIPKLREHSIDEVVLAVGEKTSPENPVYIKVDEEDGQHVEIYIG